MGLVLMAYCLLAITGSILLYTRIKYTQTTGSSADGLLTSSTAASITAAPIAEAYARPDWLRPLHFTLGGVMVFLVLLLLSIGVVGTLGEFGHLGHSVHLPVGIVVVALALTSAWSATRISPQRPWARRLHLMMNGSLLVALVLVTATGWRVVQKYL